MKVVLLSPGARLPTKQHESDAGFDLYSPESFVLQPGQRYQVKLGIAIEIDKNEVALVQGRSSMAFNYGVTTIGNVIDSGYRGEISAIIINLSSNHIAVSQGDRVAQLLILKLGDQSIEVVDGLSKSDRGDNGTGSTGK